MFPTRFCLRNHAADFPIDAFCNKEEAVKTEFRQIRCFVVGIEIGRDDFLAFSNEGS